jgi:hypothetical protein
VSAAGGAGAGCRCGRSVSCFARARITPHSFIVSPTRSLPPSSLYRSCCLIVRAFICVARRCGTRGRDWAANLRCRTATTSPVMAHHHVSLVSQKARFSSTVSQRYDACFVPRARGFLTESCLSSLWVRRAVHDDPTESHNLRLEQPAEFERMHQRMMNWYGGVHRSAVEESGCLPPPKAADSDGAPP